MTDVATNRYLVEEAEREHKAVGLLPTIPFLTERIVGVSAILDPYFCWHLLRLKKRRLQSSLDGDIDLLMGPLAWNDQQEFLSCIEEEGKSKSHWHPSAIARLAAARLAERGGLKWPPSQIHLVAIEAKCAYLNPQATEISPQHIKSTKTSKQKIAHTRAQLVSLVRMGFDKVILLDIIANPPVTGLDGQAWFTALEVATLSRKALSSALANRLPSNSPVGHCVWSIGSVAGGNESQRGAGSPLELRQSIQNPLLESDKEVQSSRTEVDKSLLNIFSKLPRPQGFHAVFLDCEQCGNIHPDPYNCASTT